MAFRIIKRKPFLTVFAQHRIGGVQSLFYNLLSNDRDNLFNKQIIFYNRINEVLPVYLDKWNICDERIFDYSPEEEEYLYRRRLNTKISSGEGALVTSFSLELKSITPALFKDKTIYHITHDEGFLNVATQFQNFIDVFIAHNYYYVDELKKLMPHRINDVFYLPYGIPIKTIERCYNTDNALKVMFLSRLDKSKGIMDLPIIDDILIQKGIAVEWTILGDGIDKEELMRATTHKPNFIIYKAKDINEINEVSANQDIYILPSRLDGLPVSLLETMSMGVVPIVSEFNPGIKRVIDESIGYVLPVGLNEAFAGAIIDLHNNRARLKAMSVASVTKATSEFNAETNFGKYYNMFVQYRTLRKTQLRTPESFDALKSNKSTSLNRRVFEKIKSILKH